jgi:hypothetical protein
MNAPSFTSRSPIPLALLLCAAVGTYACGAAPSDAQTASPDSGTTTPPHVDAGSPPGFDASVDASALEGGSCPAGHAACDHNPSNGCETTVTGDPKNCGSCGHDCTALPHVNGADVTCDDGVCVVPASACSAGYAHCSSNPDDGCEADLGTPQTCATCATQCSGATPDCSGGSCTDGCSPATLTSCNGSCVDTTSSSTNCGTCGNACPVPAHGSATCAMNTCGIRCAGAFHACGDTCADNTSPATCGSSCTACPTTADGVSMAICSAEGVCGVACDSSHHSCDMGMTCSSNTDPATCGASCAPCAAVMNATASCPASTCEYACDAGYTACGGTPASGCVDLSTDASNCGACAHPCLGGTCAAGVCQPVVLATASWPDNIVVDSMNVYFTYGTDTVRKQLGAVSKMGGALRTANATSSILTISAYGGYVSGRGAGGDVWSVEGSAINGQSLGALVTDTAGDTSPSTVIATGLSTVENVTAWIDPADDEIRYVNESLGVFTPLQLYKSTGAITLLAVAPDGYFAWADAGTGGIMGGKPTESYSSFGVLVNLSATNVSAGGVSAVTSVAVDDTYVYAAGGADVGANTRAGANAGGCTINGATTLGDLAPDATNVYVIERAPIVQIQKNLGPSSGFGQPMSTVVWTDPAIEHLTGDATALYWTDYSTGQVLKLAK